MSQSFIEEDIQMAKKKKSMWKDVQCDQPLGKCSITMQYHYIPIRKGDWSESRLVVSDSLWSHRLYMEISRPEYWSG